MADHKNPPKYVRVGGTLFEKLAFNHLKDKYGISEEEFYTFIAEKNDKIDSLPLTILRSSKLSSLESIVKFLRENRHISYTAIGRLLDRNPKTLAVTYNVTRKKMPERFPDNLDSDNDRIPFEVFSKDLSILESICSYLKSRGQSYADIARMICKDQRTVWTVCKRAEKKSSKTSEKTDKDDRRA